MKKPYVTSLPASQCVLGTAIWFDSHHAGGLPCRVAHPQVPGTSLEYPPDPDIPCIDAGWIEYVRSYRQSWVHARFHGTWINGRLYAPDKKLQIVVGASVRSGA